MTIMSSRPLLLGSTLLVMLTGCGPRRAAEQPSPKRATDPSAAAATVNPDGRVPAESVEQMLEGRIAGVVVSRTPDGSIAVRIRGASSAYGNNEPLYILDGLPLQPGPNGALAGINPRDIASIRVLKEAADIAMYGSRGANGVIIIKTKRPQP